MSRLESVIEKPRPFVRTESYFGPDRRRKLDACYSEPERRKVDLEKVRVSVRDLSEQQRNALQESRNNVAKVAGD